VTRIILIYFLLTTMAIAFHEHTFAVFELRELLLERTLNLWELLEQLEYVPDEHRGRVYSDIRHIQHEINQIMDQLIQLDRQQHP